MTLHDIAFHRSVGELIDALPSPHRLRQDAARHRSRRQPSDRLKRRIRDQVQKVRRQNRCQNHYQN